MRKRLIAEGIRHRGGVLFLDGKELFSEEIDGFLAEERFRSFCLTEGKQAPLQSVDGLLRRLCRRSAYRLFENCKELND